MWPGPLGAAWSNPSGDAVQLVFQAVRCDSWSNVPANMPDVQIDDTNGQYLQWGPPTASPVPAYDGGSLPPGCTFADGVEIRLSGQENGISLVPGIAQYQPPGQEDGSTTTLVGHTGTSGPGELRVGSADLTSQQQFALFNIGDGGGLWAGVVLQTMPGAFANLRCHRDTYNADNREVIRPSPVDATAVCVAFAVGVASAPSIASPPPGTPPSSQDSPPPGSTAPAPAPSSPTGGAPTNSQPPAVPTAPTAPANPGVPGGPAGTAPTQAASPAHEQALGAPVGSAVPAAQTPAAATAAVPVAPALPVPPPGPPKLAPTTMSLLVEVGGVTRGSSSSRPGAARSPWIRPVKVQLDCGEHLTRDVIVPVGQVPGFRATSEPVILPAADQACMVRTEDAGVDLDTHRSDVSLMVDGSVLATGQWLRIRPKSGVDKLVTVNVTFGVANSDEASPPTSEPAHPSGDQPLSLPVTLSLAGVFAVGLAGAVLRSRRPF
jgi:hypothetical protein